MAIERDAKLLTASDVAELCEVDLKTIHNWVDRGCIPHFRTPGRHLRFQAVDVANFLREWGYAIPRRFYAQIAQTVVVIGSEEAAGLVTRAVGSSVTVRVVPDLIEALVRIGAEPTSAVVFDEGAVTAHRDIMHGALGALQRAHPIPVVALGEDSGTLAEKADVLFVPPGDSKMLRAALTGDVQDAGQVEEGFVPPPARKGEGRVRRG